MQLRPLADSIPLSAPDFFRCPWSNHRYLLLDGKVGLGSVLLADEDFVCLVMTEGVSCSVLSCLHCHTGSLYSGLAWEGGREALGKV
jgi:hypothetical protein